MKVTRKTNLEIAKELIKENIDDARCGIFNTRNIIGDPMSTLFSSDELTVDICYTYEYFEVFGLTTEEFAELERYYEKIRML